MCVLWHMRNPPAYVRMPICTVRLYAPSSHQIAIQFPSNRMTMAFINDVRCFYRYIFKWQIISITWNDRPRKNIEMNYFDFVCLFQHSSPLWCWLLLFFHCFVVHSNQPSSQRKCAVHFIFITAFELNNYNFSR